ncbi:hypothetical protein [Actinomadura macrotermitis]|uniref:hypothetical protein n=1 Tax=Actinomadura macrotermitis TaxID=2585200 RepID=UPI0018865DE3|nr:hypothetical protein [Actinomadura macrotermitis]
MKPEPQSLPVWYAATSLPVAGTVGRGRVLREGLGEGDAEGGTEGEAEVEGEVEGDDEGVAVGEADPSTRWRGGTLVPIVGAADTVPSGTGPQSLWQPATGRGSPPESLSSPSAAFSPNTVAKKVTAPAPTTTGRGRNRCPPAGFGRR